jgi:hypothetical protein
MNSVLLGVDFITTDEDILLLEMNTDINLSYAKSSYFDFDGLFNYIVSNEFSTLRIIYKSQFVSKFVVDIIKEKCTLNNVIFDEIIIPANGVTIPSYTDDSSTLNLRFAYNAQAILDDTYCRDKNELINLLFEGGSGSILPKTFTTYNGEVLDTLTSINDNGEIPNLISKKQLPDFDKSMYPEFIKVDTLDELESVKSNLNTGLFLQEYKFSPTNIESGSITTHIRQWYLITNQLSEIIDLGGYLHSNQIPLDETIIEYTDLKLNNKSRYMFFSNPNRVSDEGIPSDYKIDVMQEDGSFIETAAADIQIGDNVKALLIDTLGYDFNRQQTFEWEYTGSVESLISYTSASVVSIIHKPTEDWLNKITYTNGDNVGYSLLPTGKMLLVNVDGVVKFKNVIDLVEGDTIFNSSDITSTITSIDNEYFTGSITTIDIEPSDVFIAGTNSNEILNTLVIHNYCPNQK